MKVSISFSVPKDDIYTKADEIRFYYKDHNYIPDFYRDYQKPILLDMKDQDMTDDKIWREIKNLSVLTEGNFVLALYDLTSIKRAIKEEFKWYTPVPVESYYNLRAILELAPEYITLGPALFFNIEYTSMLAKISRVQIRHAPNVAYEDGLPHGDGVVGMWILPQYLEYYEPYISMIEFHNCDHGQEKTLYDIYMVQKAWRQRMDLIITNFSNPAVGRLILPETIERRLNCQQLCQVGRRCSICQRACTLADPERYERFS